MRSVYGKVIFFLLVYSGFTLAENIQLPDEVYQSPNKIIQIFRNPGTISASTGQSEERIQMHLIGVLAKAIRTKQYPSTAVDEMEYLFSYMSALASENVGVQRFAYRLLRSEILPTLANVDVRERLLRSVRQRHNRPSQRVYTTPILLILEKPEAAAKYLEALVEDPNVEVRRRAIATIAESEVKRSSQVIQKALVEFLWDSDRAVRKSVADTLSGRDRAAPVVLNRLVEVAGDGRYQENARVAALYAIGKIKKFGTISGTDTHEHKTRFPVANQEDIAVYEALTNALGSRKQRIRETAAIAFEWVNLGMKSPGSASLPLRLSVRASQRALVKALSDSSEKVRTQAAAALGLIHQRERISDPRVFKLLLEKLNDGDAWVERTAAKLIKNNRPRSLDVYLDLLKVVEEKSGQTSLQAILNDTITEIHDHSRGFPSLSKNAIENRHRETLINLLVNGSDPVKLQVMKIFSQNDYEHLLSHRGILSALVTNLSSSQQTVKEKARLILSVINLRSEENLVFFSPEYLQGLAQVSEEQSSAGRLAKRILAKVARADESRASSALERQTTRGDSVNSLAANCAN